MGWPSALQLHLFGTALISMAMWFYSLHLKLSGHSWFQWWESTQKLVLPNCKWKDLKFTLQDECHKPPVMQPKSKPIKSMQKPLSKTAKLMLASMAALSSIQTSNPFQLQSDKLFHKDLRGFKSPLGGIDSNKLSSSSSKPHVHKALLHKMQSDTAMFHEILGDSLVVVSSVIDSGASFTSINSQCRSLIVPGTMVKLDSPIELDGIAGGHLVEWKCQMEFECVNMEGSPYICTTEAFYHEDLVALHVAQSPSFPANQALAAAHC